MPASVVVKEFKSEAEMRAHYAALHRKCFTAPVVAVKPEPVEEQPTRDEEPVANRLDHEAWAEYVARCKEMYGVTDFRAIQLRSGRASITAPEALRVVAEVTGFSEAAIKGKARKQNVVRARQIACWVLVNRAGKSLPEAGRLIGNRDHTTVLHGCRRVETALETIEPPLPASVEGITQLLSVIAWPRAEASPTKRSKARRHACVLCGSTLKAPE